MLDKIYDFLRRFPEFKHLSDDELHGEVVHSFIKGGLVIANEGSMVIGVSTGIPFHTEKVYYNWNVATDGSKEAAKQLVEIVNRRFPSWQIEFQRNGKSKRASIKMFERVVRLHK